MKVRDVDVYVDVVDVVVDVGCCLFWFHVLPPLQKPASLDSTNYNAFLPSNIFSGNGEPSSRPIMYTLMDPPAEQSHATVGEVAEVLP